LLGAITSLGVTEQRSNPHWNFSLKNFSRRFFYWPSFKFEKESLKLRAESQVLLAHACNPSYLGGWDWKYHGSRPVQRNSFQDPISKITRLKWTGGVVQAVECLLCKPEALSSNFSLMNEWVNGRLCVVTHACDPKYSNGRDQEDSGRPGYKYETLLKK
jgi:hypothetical protein